MASCSVVRIGPASSPDCSVIRSAVLRHFRTEKPPTPAPGTAKANDSDELAISNRYFDAHVRLVDLTSSPVAVPEGGGAAEDGIVLVFDSTAGGFDGLASHHDDATASGAGDLLRLCVSCSRGPSPLSDGTEKSEAEYSRRVLWCLDRGYEYVEADVTEEGLGRGHDERDKEGFARVVEALGGCMWTSRVMRWRGGVAKAAASPAPSAGVGVGDKVDAGQSSASDKTSEDTRRNKPEPSSQDAARDDAEREERAVSHLMREVKEDEDSPSPTSSSAVPPEELVMHKLEQTLSEARMIREASRNDTMSDEERRRRAGDAAIRLVGLLGEMGLGDDSDDEDEEIRA